MTHRYSHGEQVGMEDILETVLDDIDQMMSQQDASGSTTMRSNPDAIHPPSPYYIPAATSSCYSHSSSSSTNRATLFGTNQRCEIDELLMAESRIANPSPPSSSSSYHPQSNIDDLNPHHSMHGIQIFRPQNRSKLQLKDHIFISKDCTYRLHQYLVKENWGKQCSLLYKYLDYIFRCQCFAQQVIEIQHESNKKLQFLLFHTGLQRGCDNKFLYALLVPNSASKLQKWRVQYGHIRNSFVSYDELIYKLSSWPHIAQQIQVSQRQILPQRTRFSSSIADLLYDDTCSISANWEERIRTNQDRIYKVMGDCAFFDDDNKILKLSQLIDAFVCSLPKIQRIAQLNPRLAVAQGFVDTKHGKYRMELLLPIIIRFPKYNGNYYKFALAIGKQHEKYKQYVVKSILTLEMAYANARLVGYVDSLWLCNGSNSKKKNTNINDFCLNL